MEINTQANTETNIIPIARPRCAADDELARLLGELRFDNHYPAMGTGDYWRVFARAWPPTVRGDFDAQVSIEARGIAAGRADGRGIALGRENLRWLAPAPTDELGSEIGRAHV